MRLIDATKWDEFYKQMTEGLKPYDHYDDGYRDAMDNVDDWMDGNQVEAEPVRHGRWELEVRSFYMDTFFEDIELAVYILAHCSECGEKHPNANQVFSKTLYAPDDAGDDFRFDREAEEAKALEEFKQRNYSFAHYCPNCGAKMDLSE